MFVQQFFNIMDYLPRILIPDIFSHKSCFLSQSLSSAQPSFYHPDSRNLLYELLQYMLFHFGFRIFHFSSHRFIHLSSLGSTDLYNPTSKAIIRTWLFITLQLPAAMGTFYLNFSFITDRVFISLPTDTANLF